MENSNALPYKVATLLYAFDATDSVLLMRRNREPNRGLWSPPGGKLDTTIGESPHACAVREAKEELGLDLTVADVRMVGIVSENGYLGAGHWLIFLFEIAPRLKKRPPPIDEGSFQFFSRDAVESLDIPESDRDWIWPAFWRHRFGFFSAHLNGETGAWELTQSTLGARD